MPFIPHTQQDIGAMLAEIGIDEVSALFDEIPHEVRSDQLNRVPEAISEMQMLAMFRLRR